MRRGILAVGILAGTIIGAGVFSLPYIFSKVGVVAGVLMLISFACLYGVIHARYGGVLHAFRDGGNPGQFAHFAKRAFSPRAARFASGIVVAELVLTLTAYIVLSAGFAGLLGVPRTVAWAVFWAIGSAAFFLKTRALGVLEIFGTVGVFLICALIGFSTDGATLPLSPREIPGAAAIFSYIGAMIFSFSGRPAIPHVGALFGRVRIPRRIIFWGMLIPLAFYLIFPVSVLRLTDTPAPDTVSGVLALSPVVAVLVGVLGLITLFTSYIVIGDNLFEILKGDVFRAPFPAALVAVVLPMVLVFLGLQSFLAVIGMIGGVFLSLEAMFVNRMWEKASGAPPYMPLSIAVYVIFGSTLLYHMYLVGTMLFH